MDKRIGSPELILENYGRRFLRIWGFCDKEVAAMEKGPDWDDRCKISVDAITKVKENYKSLIKTEYDLFSFIDITQSLYSWKQDKHVYSMDADLMKTLINVENIDFDLDMPAEILKDFKETTFAVVYKNALGKPLTVFYHFSDYSIAKKRKCLSFNAVFVDSGKTTGFMVVPIIEGKSIKESIITACDEEREQYPDWSDEEFEDTKACAINNAALFLTIATYINSSNADIELVPTPVSKKKDRRVNNVTPVVSYAVGRTVGKQLAAARESGALVDATVDPSEMLAPGYAPSTISKHFNYTYETDENGKERLASVSWDFKIPSAEK